MTDNCHRVKKELPLIEGIIRFRVRYQETDQMGVVYHGNYFTWFEIGRTELLREAGGIDYRELEQSTLVFAVVKADCTYKKPARYDDILTLHTKVSRMTRVTIEHEYRLFRDEELLAVGHTVLASCDRSGRPRALPPLFYAMTSENCKNNPNEVSNELL